ncbi:hypothetical protein V501_08964 [Pseudogymnoascus sp. VKM F-4519 (FW-2642)]|nr:hypothetical protein V501_08964 [Pseudogymnoascus sp. VKM F-4519 (FW-2642)]
MVRRKTLKVANNKIQPGSNSRIHKSNNSKDAKMVTTRARKELSLSNCTQIATIIVGEQKKEWRIPSDILCFHSAYFKAALRGSFLGGKEQKVEFQDENPAAFEVVVEWLYTHAIKEYRPDEGYDFGDEPSFARLLDTWVLADYLQMPKVQNAVMNMLNDRVSSRQITLIVEFTRIYDMVADNSRLKIWMADTCAWSSCHYNDLFDSVDVSGLKLLRDVYKIMSSAAMARKTTSYKFPLLDKYLFLGLDDDIRGDSEYDSEEQGDWNP